MNIQSNTNITFKGYDVLPLRGFYMQGIRKRGEINIFSEIKNIAKKEGLDLFLNQDGMALSKYYTHKTMPFLYIPIWAQDEKAFVFNKFGKNILWNKKEPFLESGEMDALSDYKIYRKNFLPRGGNYYLGYKPDGTKWMIINSTSIGSEESFKEKQKLPTVEHIHKIFDIKPENLCTLKSFNDDLDEIIRPIGFPYILVNDYRESWKILNKMKEKFPKSQYLYDEIRKYLTKKINSEMMPNIESTDIICKKLKSFGFKPIRIGGRYIDDVNYINAIAFENKKGKISYITNSAKKSYQELMYIESLFENDLREKVQNISDTYFVSGGKRTEDEKLSESSLSIYGSGLLNRNVIMDILANRLGGVHCMVAEIPDFDKIIKK